MAVVKLHVLEDSKRVTLDVNFSYFRIVRSKLLKFSIFLVLNLRSNQFPFSVLFSLFLILVPFTDSHAYFVFPSLVHVYKYIDDHVTILNLVF